MTRAAGRGLAAIGPAVRKRQLLNRLLKGLGYVPAPTDDMDAAFWPAYELASRYSMTSVERMYAVWTAVNYVHANNVSGDLVECGVWRGGCSMMMALALQHCGDTERRLYLFDTFAGMTAPSDAEPDEMHRRWRAASRDGHNEWCYATQADVRTNMLRTGFPEARLTFVEGAVEDTLPDQAPESIAVLRLDTDWFESTYHELAHLYDRIVLGGALIIDDYGHHAGARAAVDRFIAERGVPLLLSRSDYTGRMAVKLR